jgi:hypothetical protein
MNNINFLEQYKIINDLLVDDVRKIDNKKKMISSSLKSSLLSKIGTEREQILEQDLLLNKRLVNIAQYRIAIDEAFSEKREVYSNNYLS